MKKNLLILVALLTSATISAQNGGTIMKKYENQLPQAGRGNVHVAYQGKAIDQMIYDFMEEQGIPGMTLAIVQAPYIPVSYTHLLTEQHCPCRPQRTV